MSHSSLSPLACVTQATSIFFQHPVHPSSSNIPFILRALESRDGQRHAWAVCTTHCLLGPSPLACAAAPVAAAILSFFISSPAMANICIHMNALSSNGKTCNLQNKGITSLNPGSFAGIPRLAAIYLEGNKIRTLPEGVFSGLKNLRTISLRNNNLVNLPATTFNGLEKLETIHLQRNNLVSLPAKIFDKLENLRKIYL